MYNITKNRDQAKVKCTQTTGLWAKFPALLVVVDWVDSLVQRCWVLWKPDKMGTAVDIERDARLREIQREYLEFLEDEASIIRSITTSICNEGWWAGETGRHTHACF